MRGDISCLLKFYWLLQICSGQKHALPSAVVRIVPGSSPGVRGDLVVEATANGLIVKGQITGLNPGYHGFHIHEIGDLGNGCKNAGGHFNPFNYDHGDPRDLKRHIGDFGNIVADEKGVANINTIDFQASLDPSSRAYIGNLSFVVHAGRDDLGRGNNPESLKTGNAGARVGCGLIELQKERPRQQPLPQPQQEVMICSAVVKMVPGSALDLNGELTIKPTEKGILIEGQITGLTPGLHGFHIHEKGDLGNKCKNAGGHFNPFKANHGSPEASERHVGDLGNIEADETRTANIRIFDTLTSMNPSFPAYIGNLSIVVHDSEDDLGKGGNPESLKTGNAGARLGCGIIEVQHEERPISEITDTSQQQQEFDVIQQQQQQHRTLALAHESDVIEQRPSFDITEITQQGQEFDVSQQRQEQTAIAARVQIVPGSTSDLAGALTITASPVIGIHIKGQITGLTPGLHGFHIHEKGDLGNGCKNAGSHFNPHEANHGALDDSARHVGDLGNIEADETGTANIDIFDPIASLDLQSRNYIGNLSVVVHASEDDLGKGGNPESLKTGNAGARSGCGIIEVEQHPQQLSTDIVQQQDLDIVQQHKKQQIITSMARVKMVPGSTPGMNGELTITGTKSGIFIDGQITGLTPGLHGFHIHEKGDLGNGCKNAGSHFNPHGTNHGAPEDSVRHVGDLGNIETDETGTANVHIFDSIASLDPSSTVYIGNLSVVVHVGEDDLGRGGNPESLKTGNAGARSGCGIIEVVEGNENRIIFPNTRSASRFKNEDFAVVQIVPGLNPDVTGELTVSPRYGRITISGFISGLKPGLHGFHIHEKGDLGNDCKNAGGHFNPFGANHGAPEDQERHVGDLGNIRADETGTAFIDIDDSVASLNIFSKAYIGNLSVVVHAGEDDLGKGGDPESLKTGNAGAREACGFIRIETFDTTRPTDIHQVPTVSSEHAVVRLIPGENSNLSGGLSVSRTEDGILITGQITGLTPGLHGFHIHEKGDLGNGCKNAGVHFNPLGANHGAPEHLERHVGDLGNIKADETGIANINILDTVASLDPSSPVYIGNLSIVVHVGADDLGKGGNAESLKTGNAGARVGCGIIEDLQQQQQHHHYHHHNQQQQQQHPGSRRKRSFVPKDFNIPFPDPFQTSAANHFDGSRKKTNVKVIPGNSTNVHGHLEITDVHTGLIIKGVIYGLSPGLHGFHIHEKGALGNKCQDAGGHFNPFNVNHGDVTDFERHVGDLGNIKADSKGVAHIHIFDPKGSLDPHSQAFVGHRAVVVHANPDDLGRGKNEDSKRTGNSGTRLGCGLIEMKTHGSHHGGQHHQSYRGHNPGHHQPHQGHAASHYEFPRGQNLDRYHQPHYGHITHNNQPHHRSATAHHSPHHHEGAKIAYVKVIPGNSTKVNGELEIADAHNGLIIKGVIYGLSPGLHGFHIHERGALGNKCQDAGAHFNPFDVNHGDVTDFERHVGDLGNVKADSKGVAHIHIFDPKGSLDPHSEAFVGHRAVVVHANPDDLGRGKNEDSKRTGNSGTRLGCGIIELKTKDSFHGNHHGAQNHHHHHHNSGHHQPHQVHPTAFHHQHQEQVSPYHHMPQGHVPTHHNSHQEKHSSHEYSPKQQKHHQLHPGHKHEEHHNVPVYRPTKKPQLNLGKHGGGFGLSQGSGHGGYF